MHRGGFLDVSNSAEIEDIIASVVKVQFPTVNKDVLIDYFLIKFELVKIMKCIIGTTVVGGLRQWVYPTD
jgi:hypothetical protein